MSKFTVFIDGESGTTGLQIRERLVNHNDIEIVSIEYDKRRDNDAKLKILSDVDITILCLPDDAAKEAVALIKSNNIDVRVLDASSAHRIADEWVYGLAELAQGQRDKIRNAKRVSNPGCYATGANLLLKPLIQKDVLSPEQFISINAVSGYTGGGKTLIEAYEAEGEKSLPTIGLYGLNFNHKHTPEIQTWSGLNRRPLFIPSVAAYAQGMLVHTAFQYKDFRRKLAAEDLVKVYQDYYAGEEFVAIHALNSIDEVCPPYLSPHGCEGANKLDIFVYASDEYEEVMVVAKLDNLGKGASGAAVQNLNIMLGLEENVSVTL